MIIMKIGASTLAGIDRTLAETLEFIEDLGLDYAELVHQFPFIHHLWMSILLPFKIKAD